MLLSFHVAAPPVGSVEVSSFPAESTAAQKRVVGQDRPARSNPAKKRPGGNGATCQVPAPPAGSVEVTTRSVPCPVPRSSATQRVTDGHEIAVRCKPWPSATTFHAPPAPGAVETAI